MRWGRSLKISLVDEWKRIRKFRLSHFSFSWEHFFWLKCTCIMSLCIGAACLPKATWNECAQNWEAELVLRQKLSVPENVWSLNPKPGLFFYNYFTPAPWFKLCWTLGVFGCGSRVCSLNPAISRRTDL